MSLTFMSDELEHPDYTENINIWNLITSLLKGKEAVDEAGTTYLPKPLGRTDAEYGSYQKRAVLYNATARTLDGLLGAIFRKDARVDIPDQLEYLKYDTDGEGNTITQFSKKVSIDVISHGRAGLLVDYPTAKGIRNLADERSANLRARIQSYCPQSIVNWSVARDGGILKLTHVMLKEDYAEISTHVFKEKKFTRYRLCELDDQGYYVIRILEPKIVDDPKNRGAKITVYDQIDIIEPTLPNGRRLDFIPFKFIGAVTNTPKPNKSPLYDLAQLNLAHYRNSADYEEALFMLGQPTPYITGLDSDFIEKNQSSLRIGSRACWLLPEGAEVGLLESKSEKNLLQKGMELKEAEMIGLGARLVQDNASRGSESSESVSLRRSGEASQMACIADNVSSAIQQALEWCAVWQNVPEVDIKFSLNKDFFTNRLTHNDITALVSAWQGGAISHKVVLDNLRKGEIIDSLMSDEEVTDDISNEDPNLNIVNPLDQIGVDDADSGQGN